MRFRIGAEIIAGTLLTLVFAGANWFSLFEPLEVKTLDWRFHLRRSMEVQKWKGHQNGPVAGTGKAGVSAADALVLVPITDSCLEDLEFLYGAKKYPIPRKIHARVVDFLTSCGARVIGFDIFFDMASQNPAEDSDLIRAVRESGKVVLPLVFDDRTQLEDGRLVKTRQVVHSFESLAQAALSEGFINVKYETLQEDGIFRKTRLVYHLGNLLYPSFPLALAARYLDSEKDHQPLVVRDLGGHVSLGDRLIPRYSDENGPCFYINYVSLPEIPRVNYGRLLRLLSQGEQGIEKGCQLFKDKIVIIGPSLTGDFDFHITPFGKVPGMDIHGQVIRSLLDQDYLVRTPRWAMTLILAVLGIAMSLHQARAGSISSFSATGLFLVAYTLLSLWLFSSSSLFLPLVAPALLALCCTILIRFMKLYMDLWRTNRSLDRRVNELSTLYDISRSISMTLITDKEKRLNLVLDKSLDSIGTLRGSIMLHDRMTDELVVEVVRGEGMGTAQTTRLKPGQGVAGKVLATGQSMIVNSVDQDERFISSDSDASHVRQLLCVPLLVNEQPIGVVNLVNKRDGSAFTAEDEKLAATIAQQAASIIENARLYRLATIDGLTDLYVHRHFQIRLEEELRRAKRYGKHLSLILTDIDHFKNFNDKYGHQTGDLVLQAVAKVLKDTVRDIDLPARYGGEEFAVILPETDMEGAMILAERLRKKVEENLVPTPDYGELNVTISIGLACFPDIQVEERKELIEFTDLALYSSKENGRNRVTVATQEMSKT